MDHDKVPQQNISTYANNKKAMYATNEKGKYGIVASSGWKVEEEATKQAIYELQRLKEEAYNKVLSGEVSTLYFHMYSCRMDLQVLAESIGMLKWRVKRHFKPTVFKKLSQKMLCRYADTLGISIEELSRLPKIRNDDK